MRAVTALFAGFRSGSRLFTAALTFTRPRRAASTVSLIVFVAPGAIERSEQITRGRRERQLAREALARTEPSRRDSVSVRDTAFAVALPRFTTLNVTREVLPFFTTRGLT